ncbi:MAG: hypothetical protein IBJ15_00060 [Alphaproteobacteria bacterium]|nr:hypothetical protein [Alphaproteobacteria bacterium]
MKAGSGSVRALGLELFELVQASQGRSFVSDGFGEAGLSRETFFETVNGFARHADEAAFAIVGFLETHGELRDAGREGPMLSLLREKDRTIRALKRDLSKYRRLNRRSRVHVVSEGET